jgi:hypothetical protein
MHVEAANGDGQDESMKLSAELALFSPATTTAVAAICGSLVGAFGSTFSTWIVQRHQDRRDLMAKKIFHREQLYSEFITESARVIVDSLQHTFQDPDKLIPIYALVSRIRLSSSREVLASADRIVKTIILTYAQPNLTPEDIRSRAVSGDDPLRKFGEICRKELETMQERI